MSEDRKRLSLAPYFKPQEQEDRKRALKHVTVGAGIVGASTGGEVLLDRRLRRRGAKGPVVSALKGKWRTGTHLPHLAGRAMTRGASAAGVPVMAYGLWNIVNPKGKVDDLDLGRDVVRPALDHATLRDQREKLSRLRKSLTTAETERLVERKEKGTRISQVAGGLGVAALAARAPQGAKLLASRSMQPGKLRTLKRLAAMEPKATALSNTLGVASIGVGALGSLNYAAQQKLEAKQVKKGLPSAMRHADGWPRLSASGNKYWDRRAMAAFYGRKARKDVALSRQVSQQNERALRRPSRDLVKVREIRADIDSHLRNASNEIGTGRSSRVKAREALAVKKSLYDGMVKGIGRVRVVERTKPGYVTVYDSKDVKRFMPESRVTPVRKPKGSAVPVDRPGPQQLELDFGKADGAYFKDPKPLERDTARDQRMRTEAQHQAARGVASGAAAVSSAAVGARWLGHRQGPQFVSAAEKYARAKGVPKESVAYHGKQARAVGQWASTKRGRLLAGALATGAVSTGAGAVARWKANEVEGMSHELGRADAGRAYRGVQKSGSVAAGLEVAGLASRRVRAMTPAGRKALAQATAAGTGTLVSVGGGVYGGASWKRRRLERRELLAKAEDRFLRQYADRISTKAEDGYRYLRDGRNERVARAGLNAGVAGLSGAMAVHSIRSRRPGWSAIHGGLSAVGAASAVKDAKGAARWNSKMGKIKAKAYERAASGEYGRDRVVEKAEQRKKDDKRGAIAAGAVAGAGLTAFTPLPTKLPNSSAASDRIARQLKNRSTGDVSLKDVRGVATGTGERFAHQQHQDRLSAAMDDRRRAGLPAQDPSRPIKIRRARDGQMHITDGHHRVQSMLDLGETHARVEVEQGRRGFRTAVPLAFRAKYARDVQRARQVTPPRDIEEIRANAARPMPFSARMGNKVRSRGERVAMSARKPAALTALAAAASAGAGVYGGRRLAQQRDQREKVGKSMAGGVTAPVSSMSADQRASLRESVERQRRTRMENPAKFKGARPMYERGAPAKRPAGAADSYRRKALAARIEQRHGEALAENASRSQPRKGKFVSSSQLRRWGVGAGVAGAGAGLLAARASDRDRGGAPAGGGAVDVAAGGLAALGARDALWGSGGWAAKRGVGAYRDRKVQTMDPQARARVNQDWKEFQRREGFRQFGQRHPGDRVDMTNHNTQVDVGRRYPKSIPGGRGMRALAWKNHWAVSNASRVAAPVAGAALVANALRDRKVEKALVPRVPRIGGGFRRPSVRRSYVATGPSGRKFSVRGSVR